MAPVGTATFQRHGTGCEIHIGIEESEEGIEIAAVEGVNESVVLLNVLLHMARAVSRESCPSPDAYRQNRPVG